MRAKTIIRHLENLIKEHGNKQVFFGKDIFDEEEWSKVTEVHAYGAFGAMLPKGFSCECFLITTDVEKEDDQS